MFKKTLLLSLFAVPVLALTQSASGQVASSARGGGSTIWVGGEVSSFNPDYDARENIDGIGAFVDYNLTPKLGIEGQGRWLHWHNASDGQETQDSYTGGVKYRVFRYHRFSVNAKLLVGGVWITYPYFSGTKISQGSGSYFAYAPAGDVEYRVSSHWAVRGGYEYQILPSAPGTIFADPSNGLSPHGFNIGVAYRVLGVR